MSDGKELIRSATFYVPASGTPMFEVVLETDVVLIKERRPDGQMLAIRREEFWEIAAVLRDALVFTDRHAPPNSEAAFTRRP